MDLDDAALDAELRAQFERNTEKLTVTTCPVLYDLATTYAVPRVDDDALKRLVGAAIDLATSPDRSQPALRTAQAAALAGAKGYFYLDGGPDGGEFKQIQEAHRGKHVDLDSQICRFSWAKWQYERAIDTTRATRPQNERSGRNQRDEYAAELARAVREALRRPELLRAAMARRDGRSEWSTRVQELLQVSSSYVREVQVDAQLYVTRTVEPELLTKIQRTTHPWPRAVVGEAGSGKSSLLWSLHRALAEHDGFVTVLLPTTWLLQQDAALRPAEAIIEAFEEIRRADRQPILLLDTVDLMLHEESSRQALLRLVDALTVRGFSGVYSTRPQEVTQLSHDELRREDLQPYDDVELDKAVTALAGRFCPQVPAADIAEHIRRATARGLPVTEVCRSPLLLRMLFDLSTPAEPELTDVDVTGLFEAYWDRRVRRDARSETAIALRANPVEDLSALSGRTGLALLACGLPELAVNTLYEVTHTVDPIVASETIRTGIDILLERGTLVRNGEQLGYFHQTMFEFAAAKGVLAASAAAKIDTLVARTTDHGGDLFVGAVLEQTLILAGRNPLLRQPAQRAADALVSANTEAVRAIGVVAWAHHPDLLTDAITRLRSVGPAALERASRILPTIATKTPGQTISQLMLIWQTTAEPQVRASVLHALARLALRVPGDVADALAYLDPLQAIDGSLEDSLRHGLLAVLKNIAPQARSLVRATLVAMLTQTGSSAPIELDYLVEQWPEIGDPQFLKEVVRTLDTETRSHHPDAVRLGRLIAAEWRRANTWSDLGEWRGFLTQATNPDAGISTFEVECDLCAIGQFIVDSTDDAWITSGVEALLNATVPRVRDSVGQVVLRTIVDSTSRSSVVLEEAARAALATVGYAAQKRRIDSRQALLLDLFAQAALPHGTLARVFPNQLESQDWTADDRLLRIAPAAADHHALAAERFMRAIERNPGSLSRHQLDVLFSTQAMHMPRSETVFNAVVSVAAQTNRIANLNKIITSAERREGRLDRHGPQLLAHARQLLAGDQQARREGVSLLGTLMGARASGIPWQELRPVLESLDDPELLNPLIKHLWKETPTGDVSGQLEYLARFIEVRPEDTPPVVRKATDPPVAVSTGAECATAMLRILCLRADADERYWPTVRTLGLYELENEEVFVGVMSFIVVCDYLRKYGQSEPRGAGVFLNDYLERLAQGGFFGLGKEAWSRELGNVVRLVCSDGNAVATATLIRTAVKLDQDLAEAIINTIAERHYLQVRTQLRDLSESEIDSSMRVFLAELIREHDRYSGTREFPEVLQ
ncbi:hypothetical protein EV138_1097 [Kribbella voronezhensis]|uniref:Uncharacterized protein n=1 Tax=Kribbella voronezhensis TaxID=2512212 RepID=A0A4V3FJT9_9ACTN|nr:ATP-binding protein [Kribbella voronezhensis]TDU87573.1 hypothetical protein EV138_1097 [Kribbella voronezhensis]